ncbi:homocysteine S-methyltransferase family protein [Clostridium beijerinckii]|uniref:Methionine synthase n=2 Tax=Clostridium beijerinckii TaxID=1520 RepID=A0AAE2RUD4_CLOBE|nr:homocysteine S-methyltransferase family protein [Clostridium beijerinckii]ABR33580.1 homocysteine S-methyltransferase [Clostridium beijerinckii NCIMB 8052]AIU02138.1 homocysteine S-methyltransferase [Clostridium beijerinckii ATCC 35702]MBF7811995.1 homocysteine S-methyltransferase family protein [Clostridium beijerinckii]NRT25151.1 5-methyltetrahydrofolate--homocysteine methyltransferase [Clostridium beijerinckii]NRT67255.1 5-methyltetrahydrofolate--homocysteine methyltransferase [Clostridi
MGLREYIKNNILIFDGAMGTMLQKKGLKLGENPEILNLKEPYIIEEIHREYISSGANVITTNTFGANELKLKLCGLVVEEAIDAAVNIAKKTKGNSETYIALDVGPIGELLETMGTLSFDRAYEIFKRQIIQGVKSGVDIILIETMTDLYELKAAVLAAKENSSLPIFCTMTFEENLRTFTGCTPEAMVLVLEGLGVDALGVNCSLGPKQLKPIVEKICSLSHIPVMVQPNAGLPTLSIGNETKYDVTKEEFADTLCGFIDLGVRVIGGCCGTSPEYIEELYKITRNKKLVFMEKEYYSAVCTPSKVVRIDGVRIIGERINPTGKKIFKEALKNGDLDYILNQAVSQIEVGAHILDVNVGLPEIDEADMMHKVIREIQGIMDTPLQIDSSDHKAIETGLRYYNGKPILNSVNGEDEVLDRILPIVKKYGASVVGLTLDERGIPAKAEERFEIAEKIISKAAEYGIRKEDVFIDCLVLTVSAQQKEVQETLKAVRMVKEKLGVKTVLGVSNISFGLPNRELINETFLVLALANGLDLPIINPNVNGMTRVIDSYNVLYNYDKGAESYINNYANVELSREVTIKGNGAAKINSNINTVHDLKYIVVKGLKEEAKQATVELLKEKKELEIVNEYLIPALDMVGEKYEKGELFLPQLIQAAETVKNSFTILKEEISRTNSQTISKGKIIVATVKGDIHDIGKNIVKVILENYGYEMIDLGKDVPIKTVVEEAKKHNASLIGLSALMTTTLKSMEETIKALREDGYNGKIFVGGAVLTKDTAERIGADFYAKDAKESVEIARRVLS